MSLVGVFNEIPFDFPLRKCDVEVSSVDGLAVVTLHQTYFNNSNKRVNSYYRFPLYRNATVCDFVVHFSGGTIKCNVDEIEQAKKTYAEAVDAGKQAAIMNKNTNEDYDITIGNIDAEET